MFSTRANLAMEAVAKPGQVDGGRLRVRAAASPAPGAHSERYSELILCVIACQVVVDKPNHPPSLRPDRIYQNRPQWVAPERSSLQPATAYFFHGARSAVTNVFGQR